MSQLVPQAQPSASALIDRPALAGLSGMIAQAKAFTSQPAVARTMPLAYGLGAVGALALLYSAFASEPQRVLFSQLSDGERADVVAALDKASIDYEIDNDSGALTVGEDDLYRARMIVASDGALAAPQSGSDLLDKLPMGASRTLEGDRLRAALERDLSLTIQQIDGIESARIHLARAERSVFVRDNVEPSASVIVRMVGGRQLAESQVTAIANLVSGSVPGLSIDAVRVVDQHGRLLSQPRGADSDRFDLQSRLEGKIRAQVGEMLAPMVGEGNFTSEIQVELDMNEVTSARESYDKDGAVRRETTQSSQTSNPAASGVPGAMSNAPPPQPQLRNGPPTGSETASGSQVAGENSASRTYELGREVSVSNGAPGTIKRISVAVALNEAALKGAKPADIKKIEDLVRAAAGASDARGDIVTVAARPFVDPALDSPPIFEKPWFAAALRAGALLVSLILVLLMAVRPAIRALSAKKADNAAAASEESGSSVHQPDGVAVDLDSHDRLLAQVEVAQRLAREQPDDARLALRRLLSDTSPTEAVQ